MSSGAPRAGDFQFSAFPHGLALPLPSSSFAGHHTHQAQSSSAPNGALPPLAEHRQSRASTLGRRTPDIMMEDDDEELHVNAGPSAGPRHASYVRPNSLGDPKTFPYTLYRVLEDEEMSECIVWFQDEARHGFFIPDKYIFVLYVLPKYFPGMRDWPSFHKQLTNYGFVKDDWDSTQAIFFHCKNLFRQDRRDLLRKLRRKINTSSTSHDAVEEQPPPPPPLPPPCTSVPSSNVPQSMDPVTDRDLINWLLQEVGNLRTGLDRLAGENTRLTAENIRLRNDQDGLGAENRDLKKRVLKLEEAQAHHLLVMDNLPREVEMEDPTMNGKQDVAPIGGGSFHSTPPPGSTATAFGNNNRVARASGSDGIHYAWPQGSQRVPDREGNVPPVPYEHNTRDSASLPRQTPYPYRPRDRPPPHVDAPVTYTKPHPTRQAPPQVFFSTDEPASSNSQWSQFPDPTAGEPLFAQNVPNTGQLGGPSSSVAQLPPPSPPPGARPLNPGPSSESTRAVVDPPGSPTTQWNALHEFISTGKLPSLWTSK